jgi:hypothetical protein
LAYQQIYQDKLDQKPSNQTVFAEFSAMQLSAE